MTEIKPNNGIPVSELFSLECQPIFYDWQFQFKEEHGSENRLTVMKEFAKLFKREGEDPDFIEIPGKVMLSGKIMKHACHNDGDEIFSKELKFIKRIKVNNREMLYTVDSTEQGYYFDQGGYCNFMREMLFDIISLRELNEEKWHYQKIEYRQAKLCLL